jgi:serine/threonine protein kinase
MPDHDHPVVGRYELVEQISVGGMGTVWRGYDAVLDRPVAVKLIRPDRLVEPEQAEDFARRFRREARVTARIRHHGVPQVYDAVLTPPCDRVYLVMELLEGTSLRTYAGRGVPLPVAWAAAVAAQIATVLSYAHAVPVVHRDLKPENVLVTPDGTVKVLDFGIAAIFGTDTTRITVTGHPVGTSRYMSPEQIRGARITPHCDLYALGCVLYELLCGRSVFDGPTDYVLWQQHTAATPWPPRSLRPGVPAALDRLVMDLLEKTPERRPADAREVHRRLAPFLPASGSPPPAVDGRLAGLPDPTRMFRRPNAPRALPVPDTGHEPETETAPEPPPAPGPAGDASTTSLRDAIMRAVDQSVALLREERFAQAAEVLQEAIVPAAGALGAENPHVLKLRARRASILVLGGRARPSTSSAMSCTTSACRRAIPLPPPWTCAATSPSCSWRRTTNRPPRASWSRCTAT